MEPNFRNSNAELTGVTPVNDLNSLINPDGTKEALSSPTGRLEHLQNPQVSSVASLPLSIDQIDLRMGRDGFPELSRHWKKFKKLNRPLESVSNEDILKLREGHMRPFLGKASLIIGASIVLGASGSYYWTYLALGEGFIPQLGAAQKLGLSIWMGVNLAGLGTLLATKVQRALLYSMEKILSLDTAYLLSKKNYLETLSNEPNGKRVIARITNLGINSAWDNSNYRRAYKVIDSKVEEIEVKTSSEIISDTLKAFLGYLDPESRKFVPGQFLSHLKDGKRSVTSFVTAHRDQLKAARDGGLSCSEGITLLQSLRDETVKEHTAGSRYLEGRIRGLQQDNYSSGSCVECKIWERDSWVDLPAQDTFYSSSSLRGVKLNGRSSRGRLGVFGNIRSKGMTSLDFSLKGGRAVRARLMAVLARDSDGAAIRALFVDGVEGTNQVQAAILHRGIEDYAKECNFQAVIYNSRVLNVVPKRFVRYLRTQNIPESIIEIEGLDLKERQYLDAFGVSIEPFEYQIPKGKVIGLVTMLDKKSGFKLKPPPFWLRAKNFMRQQCLNIVAGQAVALGLGITAISDPSSLLPFSCILGCVYALHHAQQHKATIKGWITRSNH